MLKIWQFRSFAVRLRHGRTTVSGWIRGDKPFLAVVQDAISKRYFIHHIPASVRITPAQYEDAGAARAVVAQLLSLPFDWGGVNSKWRLHKALYDRRLKDVVKMLVEAE